MALEKKQRAAAESGVLLLVVAGILVAVNALSALGGYKRIDTTKAERYTLSKGSGNLRHQPFSWELLADRDVETLFLATPHELSREWVPEALKRGMRVIDLSGAWRLKISANDRFRDS